MLSLEHRPKLPPPPPPLPFTTSSVALSAAPYHASPTLVRAVGDVGYFFSDQRDCPPMRSGDSVHSGLPSQQRPQSVPCVRLAPASEQRPSLGTDCASEGRVHASTGSAFSCVGTVNLAQVGEPRRLPPLRALASAERQQIVNRAITYIGALLARRKRYARTKATPQRSLEPSLTSICASWSWSRQAAGCSLTDRQDKCTVLSTSTQSSRSKGAYDVCLQVSRLPRLLA